MKLETLMDHKELFPSIDIVTINIKYHNLLLISHYYVQLKLQC